MKLQKYVILTLLFLSAAVLPAQNQAVQGVQGETLDTQNRPDRVGREEEAAPTLPTLPAVQESVRGLTPRRQIKNEVESGEIPENIVWERIIYRNVVVNEDEINLPLYYPPQPTDELRNLFTLIFKLFQEGKIPVYQYLEQESFLPKNRYSFEAFVQKESISYQKIGDRYVLTDENEIPSGEIIQYLIKEIYFFDQATSTFKREVLALCPTKVTPDYYNGGQDTKEALFWVKYDDLRPYLAVAPIMMNNNNTIHNYTMDDYFNKKLYVGSIVKTTNLKGQALAQQIGSTDPERLQAAQDSIELEIKKFEYQLWLTNDNNDINRVKTKVIKASKGRTQKSRP